MDEKNNFADKRQTKIWNRVFVSVFLANLCLNLSKQMINTLIARYADVLGASAVMVGFVSSAFAISALALKLISGPVNDTFNRKYVLMFACLVMACSYIGYGLAGSVNGLVAFRLLQGAGQAFTATVCLALASDALPPEQFSAGIGYFSLGQVICQTIGPSVGLVLADFIGYRLTFFLGAAVMVGAAVLALMVRTPKQEKKKFHFSLSNVFASEALLPGIMMALLSCAYASVSSFLVIFAVDQGVSQNSIGLYFTVYAVMMLFSRPFIGKMTDRFGLVRTFIPALCCYALAFLAISVSKSLLMFLAAAVISAFGFGTCQPSIQTLCMKCVPKERRGAASSTNYIGDDIGNMTGPILSGALIGQFGYIAMWRLMIIPIVLVALLTILFASKIKRIESDFLKRNTSGR